MQRYAIGIEFCGTQYRGWQTQQAGVITVQETVEKVLSTIANEPIVLHGAGRTDAGVHATNMVAHFDTEAIRPELGWIRGANSQLPKDISIQWIKCMDENFHARFKAVARRYRYVVYNAPTRPALLYNGLGLSASIPVLVATPGHPTAAQMGTIPLSETIFSVPMLITSLVIIITLPLLNAWLHPKKGEKIVEVNPDIDRDAAASGAAEDMLEKGTIASKLNNSRLLSLLIGALGVAYVVFHFMDGGSLDLNLINFIILFLGIILLGTPAAYVAKLTEGIKTISGIILQYPFYAGIMAIMAASGLVTTISAVFVDVATPETLPFWGLISSFVINFFAPSAGGHWVIQGPFMIDAAKEIGSALNQTTMAVMLGNAWNDLVQPFWILPALALSKLKLRDVMGYTVIMMLWVGVIHITAVLAWGYLTH